MDAPGSDENVLNHDASMLERAAGGPIDVAIVLGSGLSSAVRDLFSHVAIPYDQLLGVPVAPLAGHAGEALVGSWAGKRVVVFAGRVHLYQGFSAHEVTMQVRIARAAGAKTLLLTNAAGGLNEEYRTGDLMLIADHINLTGCSPLTGLRLEQPFTDMSAAYSPRLRKAAWDATGSGDLREGVYAGMAGPSYETPAEARYLRAIGADAAGMSTVLETIVARTLGMDVFGVSLITNAASSETSHSDVTLAAACAAPRVVEVLDAVVNAA